MARVEQSFEAHTKSIDVYGRMLSAEVPYIVFEAIDENDALQAVLDTAPEMLDFNGSQIRLSSIEIDERCNAEVYKVSVSYEKSSGTSESDTADDAVEISFSSGGGTKHIVRAISWKGYGNKADLNYCKDRIGWNGVKGPDAQFSGVDVPDSNLQLTLSVVKKMSQLDTKWQRNIASLTGKVNAGKFRGYERGEVLFNGASFSGSEGADDVKVSYNFSIRLNENDVELGEIYNGEKIKATKQGFQYLWAHEKYEKGENEDKGKTVTRFFRLDTVIPYADFSKLGI